MLTHVKEVSLPLVFLLWSPWCPMIVFPMHISSHLPGSLPILLLPVLMPPCFASSKTTLLSERRVWILARSVVWVLEQVT